MALCGHQQHTKKGRPQIRGALFPMRISVLQWEVTCLWVDTQRECCSKGQIRPNLVVLLNRRTWGPKSHYHDDRHPLDTEYMAVVDIILQKCTLLD